jgi:hypothetical protein
MEINSYNNSPVFGSIAAVVTDLKRRGYNHQFRIYFTSLYCPDENITISAGQFDVDESYHIGETSNPDSDRVLYAISAHNGIKGFLVDTYGVYTDNISTEMANNSGTMKYVISP